jgi:hypothetical protein
MAVWKVALRLTEDHFWVEDVLGGGKPLSGLSFWITIQYQQSTQ